jgi:hypothetical protein
LLVFAGIALPASADEHVGDASERSPRHHLGVLAGGSWATADLDRSGFPSTSDEDSSFFFAASLGAENVIRETVRLRLELEGTNERRFAVALPGGAAGDRVDLEAWTFTGNFWIGYPLERALPDTPILNRVEMYGGGGVGLSRTTVDVDATGLDSSFQKARFAWIGGVGMSIELTRWLRLDTRYQYADLGRSTATIVDSGGTPQGEIEVDLGSHELLGGLRFVY